MVHVKSCKKKIVPAAAASGSSHFIVLSCGMATLLRKLIFVCNVLLACNVLFATKNTEIHGWNEEHASSHAVHSHRIKRFEIQSLDLAL
jgi:hypothetical protein